MQFDVPRIEKSIQREFEISLRNLRDTLRGRSPVATGRYRSSWRFRMGVGSPGVIVSGTIFNPQPYGPVLEGGVPKGSGHPWASSKSGKLVWSKGKRWSSQAVGGTIDPLLIDKKTYMNNFANRIADAVIRGMR